MAITYHAGRRIQGTTADVAPIQGGWTELGRQTLTVTSSTLTVSNLPDKKYYMVLESILGSGGEIAADIRFNGDSGTNYPIRRSNNGEADWTRTTTYDYMYSGWGGTDSNRFLVGYVVNEPTKEKLWQHHQVINEGRNTSASDVPSRNEVVSKWTNTSAAINEIQVRAGGASDYIAGSELVVLGWDESDTHTTNFWEELASVQLGSAGDTLDSGTITAKKYLWFQVYTEGANTETQFKFNSTTGQEYASRRSGDGGSDSEFPNEYQSKINATGGASHTACLMNGFIINNSANEKLVITHQVAVEQTGSGTAPRRSEGVTKWANTSDSITSIQIINKSTGNFGTNSILKVWGHD